MVGSDFIYRYYIIICILLVILLFMYYNNYYKSNNIIINKDSEQLICKWNLEDEISKFTIKQDMLLKSN